jgi:transposase
MKSHKDGRSISRDALEHLRMRGIALWKKGKKVSDIADDFGVTKSAVYGWIKTYKKKGNAGLKMRKAKGAEPKLSPDEAKLLVKLLRKTADEYGFDSPLWDCKKIKIFIEEKFGKSLHFSNVWRMLKRLGLSSQKPCRKANEQDDKVVKEWIKNVWPSIQEHARRWQAMLYFQDESAVQLTAVLGTTWAKKGETPTVLTTGKRGMVGVTSAISPAGRMVFRLEKEKVKAKHHIQFIKQVQRNHPHRKIIIIEDNAPSHIAKMVDNYVESQKKKLAIYRIPTYSPELNPDEHVWNYLKNFKLKAHKAKTNKEFRSLVLSNMRSMQREKSTIPTFFYGPLFK